VLGGGLPDGSVISRLFIICGVVMISQTGSQRQLQAQPKCDLCFGFSYAVNASPLFTRTPNLAVFKDPANPGPSAQLIAAPAIFVGALSKQVAQLKNMHGSPACFCRPRQRPAFPAWLGLLLAFAPALPAAIIGTNPPARSLTAERISALPRTQQPAWKDYLKRSTRQWQADQAFFQAEMRQHGIQQPVVPPSDRSVRSIPLDQPAAWYGENKARRIADIIVSFQTPAGGWSKNLDLTQHPRAPGEYFAPNNDSRYLGQGDFDAHRDAHWNYVGTFDNDATITEMRFLAKVIAAAGTNSSATYRKAFRHGLNYVFAAQYPNGGWPQVWPLQGGYHDTITYNDNAMLNVLVLLRDVSGTNSEFAFVSKKYRQRAATSLQHGIACVLATQIVVDGRRTAWCQQHDALTLQPASARNYEMPSQVGAESADLMRFLMEQPHPSPALVAAINAAAAWLEKTKISDLAYKFDFAEGRHLVPAPGNGPLWARYYEIGTDRPVFGDRDKSIHDDVNEISKERRNGYSWYNEIPKLALEQYADWEKRFGQ
jgi:PelA/Pel-15E family pectate lyase